MVKDLLNIKRVTLEKIGNAIKVHHSKYDKILSGKIPVREFRKALRDGTVETTAPVATEDEYIIQLKTLTGLADEVRSIGGTTDEIDVEDFEKTIVELVTKLKQPEIEIKSVEYEGLDDKPTQNVLGKPDMTIVTITRYVEDTQPIIVLDAPDIDIMPIEILGEEVEPGRQLETPSIDIIQILNVSTEDVVEVVQLVPPSIELIEITFASEEITVQVLATPSIEILDINKSAEEEIAQTTLRTPQIDVLDVYFGETSEPAVKQLQAPSIEIEEVTIEADTQPSYQLGEPKIDILSFSVDVETPIIQITQLDTPDIEIIEVIGIEKMPFDNYGIIDANGKVQDRHTWAGKAHSNIVAIKDLVNGPNGYCVQDFDTAFYEYPKVLFFSTPLLESFVGSLNVIDIGNKDTLTAEEIKHYANTIFGGAAYVAFNSDYEDEVTKEDFAYILAGAKTYKPKGKMLETPSVEMLPVEIEIEGTTDIVTLDEPDISLLQITVTIEQDGVVTQLTEPSIDVLGVENFTVEESDKTQELIAPTVDIILMWVGAEDTNTRQLEAPTIEIVEINLDNTTSVLGRAILGKAVLGEEIPEDNTTSVLGRAILGKAVLGRK